MFCSVWNSGVATLSTATLATPTRGLVFPEFLILVLALRFCEAGYESIIGAEIPNFTGPILNVTAPLGREAVLGCDIDNLSAYKVAWLRVDTQTILTIHSHVITKNHRIAVTHTERRNWYLHIRDVKQTDMGWYMCQINTDPMKSQVGFLNVVVPPDILDYPTSADMVVREGLNVSLQCAATGSPIPTISWRREGGEVLTLPNGQDGPTFEGPTLNITKVNRLHMGPYLCIASNGVPPSVSKRIMLIVHFPPMIEIPNQLVGAEQAQTITLYCNSEAYPKSINYWINKNGQIISSGDKYDPILVDNAYKILMRLTIRDVNTTDYGAYKCVAKNSLGETDGTIKLYSLPSPSTTKSPTTRITKLPSAKSTTVSKPRIRQQKDSIDLNVNEIKTQEIVKEKDNIFASDRSDGRQMGKLSDSEGGLTFSSSEATCTRRNLSFHITLAIFIVTITNT
ncbi:lachesin-like isoform X1 [Euwallacea fornicatus]|uniref:lachesin-like isoform X1 n=1 Tax=Euwallacea fornicatus TaxID=995702 RepID=UPI0033906454